MRWLFVVVILGHGLIHLMGFAKAFGLAELPQLTEPISSGLGVAWLAAALLVITTAGMYLAGSGIWWAVGLAAVLVSQAVIMTAWSDAKYGTVANVVLLAGVVYGFAAEGPFSLRAAYRGAVRERAITVQPAAVVTAQDLAPMPEPVRRYLRLAGAVGQPRVRQFRATWRGRIRGSPADPWMAFTAEQHNVPHEPARFFFMDATRSGLPVDVFHAFRDQAATMRVRLASLVPLVSASGPDLTRAETVTLLNDLSLLAPAALVDAPIEWESLDDWSVRARYTVGSNTVSVVLSFNEAGELENFVSDDRLVASADGTQFTRQRWSTPVHDYRQFGPWRVGARGEGRWHPPEGEFVYIELELLDLRTNEGARE